MERQFVFTKKLKTISLVLILIGLITGVASFFVDKERAWSSLLVHNYFFLSLALGAAFWMSIQYITEAGWSAAFKRVPESMTNYLLYGFVS